MVKTPNSYLEMGTGNSAFPDGWESKYPLELNIITFDFCNRLIR